MVRISKKTERELYGLRPEEQVMFRDIPEQEIDEPDQYAIVARFRRGGIKARAAIQKNPDGSEERRFRVIIVSR